MAFVFHRRLAIPLWGMVSFAVALTAPPPATLSLITVLGIAVVAFTTPGLIPWFRSPSVVHVSSQRGRHKGSAALSTAARTCVRTLEEPNRNTAQDALDLVRMDDDGGWHVERPSA